MDGLKYPEWQIPVQEVVSEVDPRKLPGKIFAAEALIADRLLRLNSDSGSATEREAINAALDTLRAVKRERLAFPDWK